MAVKTEEPTILEVQIYFSQKGFEMEDAEEFFKEFKKRKFLNKKGEPIKNWRANVYSDELDHVIPWQTDQ